MDAPTIVLGHKPSAKELSMVASNQGEPSELSMQEPRAMPSYPSVPR